MPADIVGAMSQVVAQDSGARRFRAVLPTPAVVTILTACLVLLASCSDFGWRGYRIENQTAGPITVTSTIDGKEAVLVSVIEPGLYQPITGYPGSHCVPMLLIARDAAGSEVDRKDGDVCLDQAPGS